MRKREGRMVEGDIGIRMPVIGGPDPTERDLEKKN